MPICACLLVGGISIAAIFHATRSPSPSPTAPIATVAVTLDLPEQPSEPAPVEQSEIPAENAIASKTETTPEPSLKSPLPAAGDSFTAVNLDPSHAEAKNASAPRTPADMAKLQKAGRAEIQRQLATHAAKPAPAPQPKPAASLISQPLALAPLPTEPPPEIRAAMQPEGAQSDCCPGALAPLPDIAADAEPGNIDRHHLAVAAQHAGKGDWQAAHDTYRQLAATTQDDLVRMSLRRNLEITGKQLDIQNEPDPARREWLELDLARVHQDLGHAQAAQRLWRDLEKRGLHPDVRAQAARLRENPPAPTRPVTLPAVQSQP